jgi:predicted nucleic acid-binding protein
MTFLLDTNAISEWQKLRPNRGVLAWMDATDEDSLFLSIVTLAELRYGIERMTVGGRRRRYEQWLEYELPLRFEGRILSLQSPMRGEDWLPVARQRDGRSTPWMPSWLPLRKFIG